MIETAGQTLEVQNAVVSKVSSVRAVGPRAVLAEVSGTQDVLALQALLLENPLPGQLDVLAAAETVLVTADSPVSARRIAARLLQLDLTAPTQRDGELRRALPCPPVRLRWPGTIRPCTRAVRPAAGS